MNSVGQRVGLKPGEAFKIRLLPREIMACVAVAELVKPAAVQNVSLAQIVRFALTELCEAAIQSKLIPEPSDFDYEATTSKYRRGDLGRKVETSRVILQGQMERVNAGMTAALGGLRLAPARDEDETPQQRAAIRDHALGLIVDDKLAQTKTKRTDPRVLRLRELLFRSEQDPINMSKAELGEMKKLKRELGVEA